MGDRSRHELFARIAGRMQHTFDDIEESLENLSLADCWSYFGSAINESIGSIEQFIQAAGDSSEGGATAYILRGISGEADNILKGYRAADSRLELIFEEEKFDDPEKMESACELVSSYLEDCVHEGVSPI